jgi:hypothetical protein
MCWLPWARAWAVNRPERALERELARCTLAELLYDLRSVSAELSDEGGLLLG